MPTPPMISAPVIANPADQSWRQNDPSKVAMSKALGAAFLNHQVNELERSVNTRGGGRGGHKSRGGSHWNRGGHRQHQQKPEVTAETGIARAPPKKESPVADRIVVDASVLVHALGQVKNWCKEDRLEEVIVPLEALNTLDLLKKGTSSLAARARAASRVLEAQVGANPRIRVQRDEAFVLWDQVPLNSGCDALAPPEWLRRTICAAKWECNQGGKVVLAVSCHQPSTAGDDENRKWGRRADGDLVRTWAENAGITFLDVVDIPSDSPNTGHGHVMPDAFHKNHGRKPGSSSYRGRGRHGSDHSSLVERAPPAPINVIRVLARGEKLEP